MRYRAEAMALKGRQDEVPRCTIENIGSVYISNTRIGAEKIEGIAPESLNEYLSQFCAPSEACPCCGHRLVIEWTIVHGEARCCTCRYPVRQYHRPKNEAGEEAFFSKALPYHPSELELVELA